MVPGPGRVMGVSWFLARRSLRRRTANTIGLVLMVAISSGSVAGLVAGARRTAEAFPRFVEHSRPTGDVTIFAQLDPDVPFEADTQVELKELLDELPEVARAMRATLLIVEGVDAAGHRKRFLGNIELDPGRELAFGRPHVVAGTWPDAADAGAAAIDEELAARAQLEVGDTYRVAPYTIAQFGAAGEGADIRPDGPAVDLRVEAIYRHPIDLQPVELDQQGIYVDHSGMHFTPAYWAEHGPNLARYGVGAIVQLSPGVTVSDLDAVLQERIPGQFMFETGTITGSKDVLESIERAIELQARAMLAVAVATGATGLGLIWLLLGRRAGVDRSRDAILDDIGLGPQGRKVVVALEGMVIGTAGAVLGSVAAVVSSRWVPFGLARRAELDPGIRADVPVLVGVAAASVVLIVGGAVLTRRPMSTSRRARSSQLANALSSRGLPPVPTMGVRFALQSERDGATVPVRAAFAGVAIAAGVIVAVITVGASLGLVRDEPARRGAYGVAAVGNAASPEAADQIAARLDANPDLAGYTGETNNDIEINGHKVTAVAVFEGEGQLEPIMLHGRTPVGADEIALGGPVMDRLDVAIGDTVQASYSGEPTELRIVGQAIVEDVGGANGGPGKAGIITEAALRALDPIGEQVTSPQWFVVSLREGVDRAAALERLERDFPNAVTTPRLPSDLRNIERLSGLVVLLAVLVGVLGSGTALLAMVGAVSRRRRELAVLRALGFARRQAALTVAWQATTFALVGLVLGVPLGAAVGRRGWTAVAERIGIDPAPVIPVATVLLVALATLVALNLVAAVPAWMAQRLRPADVLRGE